MSKTIKVAAEDIKKEIDQFVIEKPFETLTMAKIGRYMRSKGYDIENYTLGRREGIKEYIEHKNSISKEETLYTVSAYRPLDINEFFLQSPENQRKALGKRERYYSDITTSAAIIFEKNSQLEKQIEHYKNENKELKIKLKEKNDLSKITADNKLIKANRVLKNIIKECIDSKIADELLIREGIIDNKEASLDIEILDKHIISANTDVPSFVGNTFDVLMGALDTEENSDL